MATPRLSRLSDFQLADRTAMKAMIDEIATEVEEQFDDIQQQIIDIAEAAKKAYVINPIPDVVIEADSAGAIKAGELTRNVNITASDGTADITTLVTWSRTVTTGITCTIGASTGVLAITAMTAQEVNIPIQFTYSGITRVGTVHVVKQNDVAEAATLSVVIDPISDVVVYANSSGTVKTGQLPKNVSITASNGLTDLTTSVTWARTATSGVTCTIGAATGILNITALSVAEVYIPVSLTYGTITREGTVHVVRQDDPPTAASGGGGGSGGTTASTTTLGATTGTAYDTTNAVSATLTVTASSAGKVQCTAPISFARLGANTGETGCYGKWQWRALAGSWADITTEVQESVTSTTTMVQGEPQSTLGSASVTHTKIGLTASTDYEFRFVWRRRDVSGTAENLNYVSGTLTADGTVA